MSGRSSCLHNRIYSARPRRTTSRRPAWTTSVGTKASSLLVQQAVLLSWGSAHTEMSGGGLHDRVVARLTRCPRGERPDVAIRSPQSASPWLRGRVWRHVGSDRTSPHPRRGKALLTLLCILRQPVHRSAPCPLRTAGIPNRPLAATESGQRRDHCEDGRAALADHAPPQPSIGNEEDDAASRHKGTAIDEKRAADTFVPGVVRG